MSNFAIRVRGLSKSFGSKKVLENVDLDIEKGKKYAVLGLSGIGKSVLVKLMVGLLSPDSGTIEINGADMATAGNHERKKIMRKVSFLFQQGALFDSMSVWENISFYQIQQEGLKKKAAQDLAVHLLSEVALPPEVAFLDPVELSGGMQRRVALARCMASSPEILICDEPVSGLDPVTAAKITSLIYSVAEKLKATTITITHDINTLSMLCSDVIMIYDCKIEWQGAYEDIRTANNAVLRQFIDGKIDGPIKFF